MKLKVPAKLDPTFQPMSVIYRNYQREVAASQKKQRFICAIERTGSHVFSWSTYVFPDGVNDQANIDVMDRIVKTLLWVHGGFRIITSGSPVIHNHLVSAYCPGGSRAFDADFMSTVYERPFEVRYEDDPDSIVTADKGSSSVGHHLDGCRIGFDAGGSDRKVSAVIDGKAVYSEEVVWFPKVNSDPQYHYDGILSAMKTAASHLPRVDAIGVSSAGVYIDNRIMVASLFIQVPREVFDQRVKNMYIDIAKEFGDVPLEVANDGDVTALAGAMSLEEGNLLGIAMGTSEAGGYVDKDMNITGRLNELAFVPVDFSKQAMTDEWSGDYGCGVKYFSQDAVIKLAPAAGIALDETASPAEKLKAVQELLASGSRAAENIFETIGVYFGYAVAYYALFYHIRHVLVMGRVTSGKGGTLIINKAQEVLDQEFPDLAKSIILHLPDEKSRRVGQSIAAASLPSIA